jgi:2-methylcitrate dehydratase
LDDIKQIVLTTHESAIRIISKTGPLYNPADRDHCLQYMVAIGLIFGGLTADHYEDRIAQDSRIDLLREKMIVEENTQFSHDYHDPEKRSIANAIQIYFNDGSCTEKIIVEYPLGHRRRREEGVPVLLEKYAVNLATRFPQQQVKKILALCEDQTKLESTPVNEFMNLLVL